MSRASSCLVVALLAASLAGACSETEDAVTDVDAGTELPDAGTDEGTEPEEPVVRSGIEGYCDHYRECGGDYYDTAQDCVDEGVRVWGECQRVKLDAWGECMKSMPCENWDPDSYNPATIGRCEEEWGALSYGGCG